jgi:hypothetical protein
LARSGSLLRIVAGEQDAHGHQMDVQEYIEAEIPREAILMVRDIRFLKDLLFFVEKKKDGQLFKITMDHEEAARSPEESLCFLLPTR